MERSDEEFSDNDGAAGATLSVEEHQELASISELQQSFREQMDALRQNIHKLHLKVLGVGDEETNLKKPISEMQLSFGQTNATMTGIMLQQKLLEDIMNDRDKLQSSKSETLLLRRHSAEISDALERSEDDDWNERTRELLMKQLYDFEKLQHDMIEEEKDEKTIEGKLENYDRVTTKMNFELYSTKYDIGMLKALIRKQESRRPECLSAEEKEVFESSADLSEETQTNNCKFQ